jgi:hypothetical protein
MSTEKGVGAESLPSQVTKAPAGSTGDPGGGPSSATEQESQPHAATSTRQEDAIRSGSDSGANTATEDEERKPAARADEGSGATSPPSLNRPRQVIAVSASKGPAAFFNLARKFLVTDEMCDLSALEGAIVSAVDAAHLLERSQLATIVRYVVRRRCDCSSQSRRSEFMFRLQFCFTCLIRVHTSYVTVEPKRRKLTSQLGEQEDEDGSSQGGTGSSQQGSSSTAAPATSRTAATQHQDDGRAAAPSQTTRQGGTRSSGSGGRELRRARIVITVRRTESYRRWLEENPLQAIIAGDVDEADSDRARGKDTPP